LALGAVLTSASLVAVVLYMLRAKTAQPAR
jgi:hypothetical protein